MRKMIYAVIGGIMTAVLWGYIFYGVMNLMYGVILGGVFGTAFICAAILPLYIHFHKEEE